MSASSEQLGAWEGVRNALAEIGACHADLDRFLCGVFDDFDRMGSELADRQRDLARAAHEESPAPCDASLREAIESLHRDHAEIVAALRGSLGQASGPAAGPDQVADDSLKTVLARLASLAGELVQSQSEQKRMLKSQQALFSGELAAVRQLLQDCPMPQPESAAPRREMVTDPALDAVLAQFERLETELVRNRDG